MKENWSVGHLGLATVLTMQKLRIVFGKGIVGWMATHKSYVVTYTFKSFNPNNTC